MNTILLIIVLLTFSFIGNAQITFEAGYFIKNNGEKVDCLIKDVDWKNNPTKFRYKRSKDSDSQTATIQDVREFGIGNNTKYQRYTVAIDRSTHTLKKLTYDKEPSFEEEELFLKVMIEGNASLYYFEAANLERFFFKMDDLDIEQLVFKKYKINENQIGVNSLYQQQLLENLSCTDIAFTDIQKTEYRKDDLVELFVKYNKCSSSSYKSYQEDKKKDLFNLHLKAGLSASSLSIRDTQSSRRKADFGTKLGYRIGVEAEIVMPFNKNKWSIIVEPNYSPLKTTQQVGTRQVKVDYHPVEVAAGVRHAFYLNRSKISVSGQFGFSLDLGSTVDYERFEKMEMSNSTNLIFSVGYHYNRKYSLEARYGTRRGVLHDYMFWRSDYQSLSVNVGYNLF